MRALSITVAILGAALSSTAFARQVDIRSRGARCDGVTDDSFKIQTAIDHLAPGDVLIVPCRASIGALGLTIRDRRDIAIRGVDGGGFKALGPTTLAAQGFSPVMILVQRCTRCVVESIHFEMNREPEAAIGFDRCVQSTLRGSTVTDTGWPANAAIVATGNKLGVYTGNQVFRTGRDSKDGARGMWLGNIGESQLEFRPTVTSNTVDGAGWTGIVVWGRGALIQGNTVRHSNGAGVKLAAAELPGAPPGPQTRIADNKLTENRFHGIQIEDAAGGVRIDGNRLEDNSISGLYVPQGEFSGEVEGNVFAGNRESGIHIYRAAGVSIRNNRFDSGAGPQDHGIIFEAVPGNSIRSITVAGNAIWDQSATGIAVWARGGQLDGLAIQANSFGGRIPSGVHIEDRSNSTAGRIALGPNCFDRQLARTLSDQRAAALPIPAAANCAPPPVRAAAKEKGRQE